jgi:hypothetical protein
MASTSDLPVIPRVKLGPEAFEVSALGLGCMGMSAFYGSPKPEADNIALIRYAVNSGVTFLDTSDWYGPHTNEVLVGKVTVSLSLCVCVCVCVCVSSCSFFGSRFFLSTGIGFKKCEKLHPHLNEACSCYIGIFCPAKCLFLRVATPDHHKM